MRVALTARKRARVVGVAVISVMALALTTPTANATLTWWRTGPLAGNNARDGDVTHAQLSSSWAWSDIFDRVASAGAHYPGGWTLYGSMWQAYTVVCQPYPNENVGSLVENRHSFTQDPYEGWAGWVNGGVGSGC